MQSDRNHHLGYAQIRLSGDLVLELDPCLKRHSSEEMKRKRLEQADQMKALIETEEFVPEELKFRIRKKHASLRSPEEELLLTREREMRIRAEKVRWLQVEQRLVDLDAELKRCLRDDVADFQGCITHLEELDRLPIARLMLKKQPDLVLTLAKLRRYVGPPPGDAAQKSLAKIIRIKADKMGLKIKAAFGFKPDQDLWAQFEPVVTAFRHQVRELEKTHVMALVADPTAS